MVRLTKDRIKKKKLKKLTKAQLAPAKPKMGGYRPGAGRPKGQKRKWSRKTMEFLFDKRKYKTPLEYMVATYNDKTVNERRRDKLASISAKYVHATLQAITNKDGEDILPDLTQLPDAALKALAEFRSFLSKTNNETTVRSGDTKTGSGKTT